MKKKGIFAALTAFVIAGTVIKVNMDATDDKRITDKVNKYIAGLGLSEKEIGMVDSNISDIEELIRREHFSTPYDHNAVDVIRAEKAKTIADMKSEGDNNLEDEQSRQRIERAVHEAFDEVKSAKEMSWSPKGSLDKFDVKKVKEDLGLPSRL